jgi:2'-5' RNA ligase
MPAFPSRTLFCALRPPAELARDLCEQFDWLEPGDDRVEPERLHVTLVRIPLGPSDFDHAIVRARRACATLQAAPFRIVMDALIVADRVLLKPSETVPALDIFQFRLRSALAEADLVKRRSKRFGAHLTISYRNRSVRRAFISPASWTVCDFVLLESLSGKRTQIERGRWVLHDRG